MTRVEVSYPIASSFLENQQDRESGPLPLRRGLPGRGEGDLGRIGKRDRGLNRLSACAALDLILFEREVAAGDFSVGGPTVEASQFRGNEAGGCGNASMLPLEVQRAFG